MIPASGQYIYVWVSNESENTEVWFDDVRVTHVTTFVTQATDYGVWGDVLREQESDESIYRFGYQGNNAEKDEETGWSHFELREYDPVIGRWLVPDPYGQFWSPYQSMANNPINAVDPTGGSTDPKPGDMNDAGQMWTEINGEGKWTDVMKEVTVRPSFWDFMDDLDAMFSGGMGFMFVGNGPEGYSQGNIDMGQRSTTGKDIVVIDVETFTKLLEAHKEWKRFGGNRHNGNTRTYDNKKVLDLAEDFKNSGDLMEKYYKVLKEHSKAHGKIFRAEAAKQYRDSLLRNGIISAKPNWIFDLDEHGDIKDTVSFWIVVDDIPVIDTVNFKK